MKKLSKKTYGIICLILSILLLCIQVSYYLIGKPRGFEYIIDSLEYLVNEVCLGLFIISMYLIIKRFKVLYLLIGFILLSIPNLCLLSRYGFNTSSLVQFGEGFKHELIVKIDKKSKQAYLYRHETFLFAKKAEPFSFPVQSKVEVNWLTSDVACLIYQSSDHQVHQFVATYGDRGSGYSYYYVEPSLQGKWQSKDKKIKLEVGQNGITLTNGLQDFNYTHDDNIQVGTTSLVLSKQGFPQWTIALNEDCKIENDGLLNNKGTITLMQVSIKNKSSVILKSVDKPLTNRGDNIETTKKEQGREMVYELRDILKEGKDLKHFTSNQTIVKVETTSEDLFMVARLAREEMEKQYAINGCDSDVTITEIKILAGDDQDYLAQINATETATCGETSEGETVNFEWKYRIMKGDNAYLATRVMFGVKEDYGIKKLKEPKQLVTTGNEAYHFMVPGIKTNH
ncbi:MAG: hypothetical protein RR863_00060 [Erysipelotrichaceae bacterium]